MKLITAISINILDYPDRDCPPIIPAPDPDHAPFIDHILDRIEYHNNKESYLEWIRR